MKKILILIISVSAVSILGYIFVPGLLKSGNKQPVLTSSADVKVIPKVLFITSGVDEGRGKISEGVIVALQTFGRCSYAAKGAFRVFNNDHADIYGL